MRRAAPGSQCGSAAWRLEARGSGRSSRHSVATHGVARRAAPGYPRCCCIKQAGSRRLDGSLGRRQNSSNIDPRWSWGGAALEPCSASSSSRHSSASSSSTSSLGRPPHGANENHCGRHLQKKGGYQRHLQKLLLKFCHVGLKQDEGLRLQWRRGDCERP